MDFIQIDQQLCAQCGGRCCQGYPGLWSDPQRFFRLFFDGRIPASAALANLLVQKELTLRAVGGILIPAPENTEQGCTFLAANGCRLWPKLRPGQCLALIPELETLLDEQIHCRLPATAGSNSARNNWRPWQKLLRTTEQVRSSAQELQD